MSYQNQNRQWRQELETKAKSINIKQAEKVMQNYGVQERQEGQVTVLHGKNFAGRDIEIRNKDRKEAYRDLATLNGFTTK